ncbi:hyaluronidase-5-like [Carcharodon carcharias]|uniref:hyaluronidase-5-like n=1 Tax=Carcharodon carcharias TaxID=13397 RepID=UPI001B7E2809|nr:hyaluronidase-5-like [Carcharodon carcharias]
MAITSRAPYHGVRNTVRMLVKDSEGGAPMDRAFFIKRILLKACGFETEEIYSLQDFPSAGFFDVTFKHAAACVKFLKIHTDVKNEEVSAPEIAGSFWAAFFEFSNNKYYSAIMRLHGCISNPVSMAIIQLALLISTCFNQIPRQTVNPLIENSPFSAVWNAPIELCETKFRVTVDLSLFEIIGSPLETITGQPITIFYHTRLGYYPYYDDLTGESFNGGIPQLAPLDLHYAKIVEDIQHYIPSKVVPGIAVINWENWRPQWIRNWDLKDIYRIKSVALVKQLNQSLNMSDMIVIAKNEFEEQAKDLMLKTLKLGKLLRPNNLWGFYLYPDCYNYNYKDKTINYTGSCPDIEVARNNELLWLWNESTALFPSIYLQTMLQASVAAAKFVRHRVQEAKRVALLSSQKYTPPLYVYTRPVFTDAATEYLSEIDLVHTIGESAALGTAGFIIWGSLSMTETEKAAIQRLGVTSQVFRPSRTVQVSMLLRPSVGYCQIGRK